MKKILTLVFICFMTLQANDMEIYIVDSSGQKRDAVVKSQVDMSLYVSNNVTRKSTTDSVQCKEKVSIKVGDKTLHISSDTFGPAPLELMVFDAQSNKIFQTSKENLPYNFDIDLSTIKNISRVEVVNYFGDKQLCNDVVYE